MMVKIGYLLGVCHIIDDLPIPSHLPKVSLFVLIEM